MSPKPPANYWATMIALGSLAISALGLLLSTGKTNAEETAKSERRICRLEALSGIGECKR